MFVRAGPSGKQHTTPKKGCKRYRGNLNAIKPQKGNIHTLHTVISLG